MLFGDQLLTPRLRLRRPKESDLELLVAWSNSHVAYGDYLTPECLDLETGRANLASGNCWSDANRLFFIESKELTRAGDRDAGRFGLQTSPPSASLSLPTPLGTLRYWLRTERRECAVMALKICDPAQRNRGYGTEAQKYVIIWLFDKMKIQQVEMYTDINNRSQQRCLNKLGFELAQTMEYDDHHVRRIGHLYRLDAQRYERTSFYRYHYED